MKHTDFYIEYKKLNDIEKQELIAAVNAHGGEYVFIHIDDDNDGELDMDEYAAAPVILATSGWPENFSCYHISSVAIVNGNLRIYGVPEDSCGDEREIDDVPDGHLGCIIDYIPETETVSDVSIHFDN